MRIVGTPSVCAERIAERESLDFEAASQRVLDVNRERADYIRKLYETDIDDTTCYDLDQEREAKDGVFGGETNLKLDVLEKVMGCRR